MIGLALLAAGHIGLAGAFRHNQAGWIYAHLQGSPTEIGYQYGDLLASEIDDAQKALRDELQRETGKPWSYFRSTSEKAWDKVDSEYQQEIDGQVAGLAAKGFSYDRWDVLAMNDYIEVADYYLPWSQNRVGHKQACSAFVATGSETADGKIVMAHNFWWDYQTGERFNVILDVTPLKGHRFVMDCMPGFLDSGTDFAINDAGLMISETTLPNLTDYDPSGIPEFVRMRKATQYAANIDEFAKIMETGNTGGYANTWLLGDRKNNEIGRLELGLKVVTLDRTKDGYYTGANFPVNPKLVAEELKEWDASPKTNGCECRRERWDQLLKTDHGKVGEDQAKQFLGDTVNAVTGETGATDFTLCNDSPDGGTNNAKVTTSDMAADLKFWARMGFADGGTLHFQDPSAAYLKDIVPHPWTLIVPTKSAPEKR